MSFTEAMMSLVEKSFYHLKPTICLQGKSIKNANEKN